MLMEKFAHVLRITIEFESYNIVDQYNLRSQKGHKKTTKTDKAKESLYTFAITYIGQHDFCNAVSPLF